MADRVGRSKGRIPMWIRGIRNAPVTGVTTILKLHSTKILLYANNFHSLGSLHYIHSTCTIFSVSVFISQSNLDVAWIVK